MSLAAQPQLSLPLYSTLNSHELVAEMGYKVILTEGPSQILKWRSPNYLYSNAINPSLTVLLNNDMLSNDIAYRISDKNWSGWPLTAPKYVSWLNKFPEKEKIVNLQD